MSQAAMETSNMHSVNVAPALSLIEKNAPEGKENRQIPKSSIEALREQGFFRMLLPKQYGGYECTPQEFFRAAIDIAERDMSTAWAGGIIAVHAYQLAIMPPQAAEEVYAD